MNFTFCTMSNAYGELNKYTQLLKGIDCGAGHVGWQHWNISWCSGRKTGLRHCLAVRVIKAGGKWLKRWLFKLSLKISDSLFDYLKVLQDFWSLELVINSNVTQLLHKPHKNFHFKLCVLFCTMVIQLKINLLPTFAKGTGQALKDHKIKEIVSEVALLRKVKELYHKCKTLRLRTRL